MNPLLLLPTAVKVRAGDVVCVRTRATADAATPTYEFEVFKADPRTDPAGERVHSGEALACLRISLQDLYPDYGI